MMQVALPDGRFAVRDDYGIQLFDENGLFLQNIAAELSGYFFGLASDNQDNLFTIKTTRHGRLGQTFQKKANGKKMDVEIFVISIDKNKVSYAETVSVVATDS